MVTCIDGDEMNSEGMPPAKVDPTELRDDGPRVVAAIPAFNEEKTIGSIVLLARRYVNQVLVVDDGSTDHTALVAERAGAVVVSHGTNRGYGSALRSCFSYARLHDVDVLVILDGDGQHRPQFIPTVIGPIKQGDTDVSIGSRFLAKKSEEMIPRHRRVGIKILTLLSNLGSKTGSRVRDGQSGFRAFSRAAINALDPVEKEMGASAELLWEANRKGLTIKEVSIEVDYLVGGSTKGALHHGLEVMGSMIRYVETEHALLFFGVPGLVLFLVGLVTGLRVIEVYDRTSELAIGTALIASTSLLLGVLLGFTGLVLHAVINTSRRRS